MTQITKLVFENIHFCMMLHSRQYVSA